MAFIRIVLLILLLYLFFQLLVRLFIRSNVRRHFGNFSSQNTGRRKEGDVTIKNTAERKSKKIDRDEGEYVSFEDIKED